MERTRMDQRGVSKIDKALSFVEHNHRQAITVQQRQQDVFNSLNDLLGDDPSELSMISGTPQLATTPQMFSENRQPNVTVTPIGLQLMQPGGVFSLMGSRKAQMSSEALRSSGPASLLKYQWSPSQMIRDALIQSPGMMVMNTPNEQFTPLRLLTPRLDDSDGTDETDLSAPMYCREATRQDEERELEYVSYTEMWKDEDNYRDGFYNRDGVCEAGVFSGSVYINLPVEEFQRRFPQEEARSEQRLPTIRESTGDENELVELDIPIYVTKRRTAFPPTEFNIGDSIRKYKVFSVAGQGTFSKTFACDDVESGDKENPARACVKMITCQTEDAFQQALSEILILRDLNQLGNERIVRLVDFFYLNSTLFLAEDLYHDNLYEVMEQFKGTSCQYFNEANLKLVAKQCLEALQVCHESGIIHCDIKPENILLKHATHARTPPDCVLIDFGSAKYVEEDCSEWYLQSRPYRSPEVILGCGFDTKVDIWSLGCVLAELYLGQLLFLNLSVSSLLAQVIGLCGPVPDAMMDRGTQIGTFFRNGMLFEFVAIETGEDQPPEAMARVYFPKPTTMEDRIPSEDALFIDFLKSLIQIDPAMRPSAADALKHEWLA